LVGLPAGDESAARVGRHLAAIHQAHFAALLLAIREEPLLAFDGFGLAYANGAWMGDVAASVEQRPKRIELNWRLRTALRSARVEALACARGSAGKIAAFEASNSDLVIMTRPEHGRQQALRHLMLNDVLIHSGRPLLLVPADWTAGVVGRHVVIAWNGQREAARALVGAQAILERADRSTIVTVDDGRALDWRVRGARIQRHLERRGHNVQLRAIENLGRSVDEVLLAECQALGADLIVMGGYGHSRLEELVFGGATRSMIAVSPVPLLLAH
jgi:nucleotide-binding universal stress UspA family protein